MAFSLGGGGGGVQAHAGPDLQEIQTEQIGFTTLGGDTKLRLLPQGWDADKLPPPTSSLLAIAQNRGLLVAAGPDRLVLARTESVRKAYQWEQDAQLDDKGVKNFKAEATMAIPRVSHVAFSSDEAYLVLTAEEGGGLAVYEVDALMGGNTNPSFQMGTESHSVRQLVPNPSRDFAHLFAVVLTTGQLLLANVKEKQLVPGPRGPVFRENVSCACWSTLGKQIAAGLGDGTAVQIDPSGVEKAQIPRPPQLTEVLPVTSIFWLQTVDFLIIHTAVSSNMPDSIYHLAHRDRATGGCSFFRFEGDPCFPMGGRTPAHHYISRLKDWAPNVDDLLILASTATPDIGLLTRANVVLATQPARETPVNREDPAEMAQINLSYQEILQKLGQTANTFTTTQASEDRKAQLPMMSDGSGDTNPIGMAIDLSVKEKTPRPIPVEADAIDESPTPLPALMVLNQEGILCSWYIVYKDSIRQGTIYPGMVVAGPQQRPQSSSSSTHTTSAFGDARQASPFGSTPAPAVSATPAFGMSSFGSTPKTPAIGGGGFGKPSFGAPTTPGFGQAGGGMGFNKPSPWSTTTPQQSAQTGGAAFGQPSTPFGTGAKSGGFAALGVHQKQDENKLNPFSAYASKSAFSGFANQGQQNSMSPFATSGSKPAVSQEQSFGSTVTLPSSTGGSFESASTFGMSTFGTPALNQASVFGQNKPALAPNESMEETMQDETPTESGQKQQVQTPTGVPGGFKLGSTFKPDGTVKDDLPKPKETGSSFFGSGFGSALGEAAKQPATERPIKSEPGTEEPKLEDIPEAPAKGEDAPLPPDPIKTPAKSAVGEGLPPDFLAAKAKKSEDEEAPPPVPEDAPLPPDFTQQPPQKADSDSGSAPIAGSPPVDLGDDRSQFSDRVGSAASGEEAAGQSEEEEWTEESADDGDEEGFSEEQTQEVIDPKGLSVFESRLTPASPKRTTDQQNSESTTPATTSKPAASHTPAGFPKGPVFAPPRTVQESPRSPSPVRNVKSPLPRASMGQSRSAPVPATTVPATKALKKPAQSLRKSMQQAPPPPAPEPEQPDDDEHERIVAELQMDVEPTLDVPALLAHQDYIGEVTKAGLGGQMENVYRDVNSMIDTLGINARNVESFVKGHRELGAKGEKGKQDLEDEAQWTLEQVDDLAAVQGMFEQELEDGRLEDVQGMMLEVLEAGKEAGRVRAQTVEVRRQIACRADPHERAAQHAAPLSPEAQTQHLELRHGVARVQKLMQQVEESMSLLRAALASLSPSPPSHAAGQAAPTVEHIANTIAKMTAMIERKSGDVDVLEAQIRRLPCGLASLDLPDGYEADLAASLAGNGLLGSSSGSRAGSGSPYATPPASAAARRRMAANGDALGMSGMLGSRLRTPLGRRSQGSDFGASVGGSARRKMTDVGEKEARVWSGRLERRRGVGDALRDGIERRGRRVVRCE